ncbi:MAG: TRAP transporter small permease [Candidatus Thiodiazotropha sp. (ex Monitilora ramsayi)]|nr:TRAP transporter small permease [Candidatus Thiodiazotropha sp. (ex Monitilora ramsayi)]
MFKRIINKAEEGIISLLLVTMTLLVFLEVVMRFGFNSGFLWAQELTLHISAWFVLFGVSYGLKVGAHIGVDAFIKLMSPMVQRVLSGVAVVFSLVYCGLFIYGSWIYLSKMKKIQIELEDLPVEVWIAHSILVIGLVFLSIRLLELLWHIAKGDTTGFRHINEAEESMHLAEELAAEKESFGEKKQ